MSQENVELVRSIQPAPEIDLASVFRDDAVAAAVIDAIAPLFHDDFEAIATTVPLEGRWAGLAGLRAMWLDWMEPWESYRTEIEEVIDAGDDVVVLVRDYGRRKGMEAEVHVVGAAVWTVRDGKLARAAFFPDRESAFAAAGLER